MSPRFPLCRKCAQTNDRPRAMFCSKCIPYQRRLYRLGDYGRAKDKEMQAVYANGRGVWLGKAKP